MSDAKAKKQFFEEFAGRLRGLRMWAGYKFAREFAAVIEVEENTYTQWERGGAAPNLFQLNKICEALEVTPNDLLIPRRKQQVPALPVGKTSRNG